jgi:hypothetical protein
MLVGDTCFLVLPPWLTLSELAKRGVFSDVKTGSFRLSTENASELPLMGKSMQSKVLTANVYRAKRGEVMANVESSKYSVSRLIC